MSPAWCRRAAQRAAVQVPILSYRRLTPKATLRLPGRDMPELSILPVFLIPCLAGTGLIVSCSCPVSMGRAGGCHLWHKQRIAGVVHDRLVACVPQQC